ncbi:MAG: hypothetical protein AAGI70_15465 [Pseudomonadota bacterium]
MLCSRPVEAPARLMDAASGQPPALTLVVGADHAVALASAKAATEAGLIEPLLLGAPAQIAALAEEAHWDIAGFQVIPAEGETALAEAATEAAADPALHRDHLEACDVPVRLVGEGCNPGGRAEE